MMRDCVFARAAKAAILASASLCSLAPAIASAQEVESEVPAEENVGSGDIVVTARRREETLISTPVAVSVVGGDELGRKAISGVDALVQSVPQLMLGDVGSNPAGGVVVIRGIGVGESNPFADQAVSFNVDGVQVSRANIRRIAEVDLKQVQVLKGPQALFFGKNSPAGIIVLETADPTPSFEAGINAGHEFVADEMRADGYVSGPLSDTLGARLAFYASDMKGYFRNVVTPNPALGEMQTRVQSSKEFGGRLTLKFDNGGPFDAKLKASHAYRSSSGPDEIVQLVGCPFGASQLSPLVDDCTANETTLHANTPLALSAVDPDIRNVPYLKVDISLVGLEMNFALSDALKLTSVTGFFGLNQRASSNFVNADSDVTTRLVGTFQGLRIHEYSQELRLASDFDGPLNFLVGTFLQSSRLVNPQATYLATATPTKFLSQEHRQSGKAASAFAQLTWEITPQFELSGGGRYSYEKKEFAIYSRPSGTQIPTARPERSWKDFSPEGTLTWRPNTDLTIYGAYKRGFLSGGFNAGSGNPANDRSFDQQVTEGFEAGIKARLLDRKLRTSLIVYDYDVTGLQVAANVVRSSTGLADQVIVNAGAAKVRGIELDGDLAVTDQFSLHGAVAYNHARYTKFDIAPCYAGQSIDAGCNLAPNINGVFTAQDLAGQHLQRAPDWSIQGGFKFDLPLGNDSKIGVWSDVSYTSWYYAQLANKPDSRLDGYALVDAGINYESGPLTVSLVGKNLTNKYFYFRSLDNPFTGSGTGTANARLSDTAAMVERGRQVLVRIGYRFGG